MTSTFKPMPIIHGFLERITYYNEENDFLVAKLQEKGKKDLTTIVGNLSGINAGESLKLSGKWVHNKKFGEQFQVETFEVTVPATVHGIKKYLGSGLIKGIGPVMAERITKKFVLETLDIIEKTPERLSEVDGIGPKRIAMITKAWEEQKEIKEIMIFLQVMELALLIQPRFTNNTATSLLESSKKTLIVWPGTFTASALSQQTK